tara:strand:- start:551 stop:880 length:330 start_codon:yes stop_codon:yes gene_type:complete
MYVIVRDNDVSKAIRLLKRKLHNEGVLKEVRDRKAFVSKGEQKRASDKAGRYRWMRKRIKLEQQFVREERNQLRNNKNKRRQQQQKNKRPFVKRGPNNNPNRIRKNVSS